MFGDFWKALQQRNYGRKTIVFFLADHGESFGQHGGYTHCARYFDEETRVPAFVYAPHEVWSDPAVHAKLEQLAANRQEYASTIDLLPTFLDLAGVDLKPFAAQLDGQPLTRALPEGRRYLISNCAEFRRCPIRAFAYYQRGIKYIYLSYIQRWFAFDLANDPGETIDVASAHQEEIAAATSEFVANPTLANLLHSRTPPRIPGE